MPAQSDFSVSGRGKVTYDATVIVSPVPNDPAASGGALRKAMANLQPPPSAGYRWLVKIEPGIYDLGTTPLEMLEYADIEGSGMRATQLRGNVGPSEASASLDDVATNKAALSLNQGLVVGASNAEIRLLTIECIASASQPACMAMLNEGTSPRLTNLRLKVTAPSAGSHWGMRNYEASPVLDNVEIEVSNSTAGGDNYGLVNVGETQLGVTTVRNSRISVSGTGTNNWALLNRGHAKTDLIVNSTLSATGGLHAYAIHHTDAGFAGDFTVDSSTVTASGGSIDSIGINQEDSGDMTVRPFVRSSNVSGETHGILMNWNNAVVVEDGEVFGNEFAVAGGDVTITGTWIRNGVIFAVNSATCTGVFYGPDHTFYPDTCP